MGFLAISDPATPKLLEFSTSTFSGWMVKLVQFQPEKKCNRLYDLRYHLRVLNVEYWRGIRWVSVGILGFLLSITSSPGSIGKLPWLSDMISNATWSSSGCHENAVGKAFKTSLTLHFLARRRMSTLGWQNPNPTIKNNGCQMLAWLSSLGYLIWAWSTKPGIFLH